MAGGSYNARRGGEEAAAAAAESETAPKSQKPTDSAFKQQRLPAWQPILTAGSVLPTFFVIGVAFIPIGVGMYLFSQQIHELEVDYTDCKNAAGATCASVINGTDATDRDCVCEHNFELDEDWEGGPVFMYYGLKNFYQNHRRYVKSRDDNQLLGDLDADFPSKDCYPFDRHNDSGLVYLPCGAIANSLFSDVIRLQYSDDDGDDSNGKYKDVGLVRTGIAWETDKKYKFGNPKLADGQTLEDAFKAFAKPRDWKKNLWQLDVDDPDNNGLKNEDLIVWMRTAALPNFRKLYRKIDHGQEPFKDERMPKGLKYKFVIEYNFEVKMFSGSKSIVLSTTSLLGGKNSFLGIAYIVVGCICFVMGVVFLFVHIKYGKNTNDMMKVTSRTPFNSH